MDNRTLVENIIRKALSRGIKLSLAESCTGGMVAAVFTEISGVSQIFMGSAVTYSNESKRKILGVSPKTLEKYGAVSSQCAEEMAKGSMSIYDSDVAMSVTGIAGPTGGSEEKPVGTVWFGLAMNNEIISFKKIFKGSREQIRKASLNQMLFTLAEKIN